jgi:hypothetical protein
MARKQAEIDAEKAALLEKQKALESELAEESEKRDDADDKAARAKARGASAQAREHTDIARASEDSIASLYERLGEVKALLEGKEMPPLEGEEKPPEKKSFLDRLWGD